MTKLFLLLLFFAGWGRMEKQVSTNSYIITDAHKFKTLFSTICVTILNIVQETQTLENLIFTKNLLHLIDSLINKKYIKSSDIANFWLFFFLLKKSWKIHSKIFLNLNQMSIGNEAHRIAIGIYSYMIVSLRGTNTRARTNKTTMWDMGYNRRIFYFLTWILGYIFKDVEIKFPFEIGDALSPLGNSSRDAYT